MPSLIWRAALSVKKDMSDGAAFMHQVLADAAHLCLRQVERAPLGGELGGTRRLDTASDLADLAEAHTNALMTPQSDDSQRELFGLSGGVSAVLPAVLYLAWKYERHPAAALTASALLGGNSA